MLVLLAVLLVLPVLSVLAAVVAGTAGVGWCWPLLAADAAGVAGVTGVAGVGWCWLVLLPVLLVTYCWCLNRIGFAGGAADLMPTTAGFDAVLRHRFYSN